MNTKRPVTVTLLNLVVFMLSAANLARAAITFSQLEFLKGLELSLPLPLAIGLSGTWGIVWLAVCVGLWLRVKLARTATLILFPLYVILQIGMDVLYTQGEVMPGQIILNVLIALCFMAGVIYTLISPGAQAYFGTHPQEKPSHDS
jgi:hypothetical protein